MGAQPVPSLGPAIARILRQYPTVRLDRVLGSGKNGRILKGDVLAAMEDGSAYSTGGAPAESDKERPLLPRATVAGHSPHPSPPPARRAAAAAPSARPAAAAAPAPTPIGVPAMDASTGGVRVKYEDQPLSPARRAAALALGAAKRDTPHRYTTAYFELDALLALQASLNAAAGGRAAVLAAPTLNITAFCVWASAAALAAVPEVQAIWDPSAGGRVASRGANVAFAVAAPDGYPLTPVVWDAGRKGLATIAADAAALTQRALVEELEPHETQGGCFSVSNLGATGVGAAQPVIHPPHAGHLAVGAGLLAARPAPTGGARQALVAAATLSSDARMVSEVAAAEFLATFTRVMGDPEGSLF